MILDRVTVTGADQSVTPPELAALSCEYPFVEWGLLFSPKRQGTPRYPGEEWLYWLREHAEKSPMKLSAHLCGKWVRDLVLEAKFTWAEKWPTLFRICERVQLNFHGQYHKAAMGFIDQLRQHSEKDWIFQHDGVNDMLISTFTNGGRIRAFPLIDRSGGDGIVPASWPAPIWTYQGYAGGLGPDNLAEQLRLIGAAVGDARVWIDMETRVRSDNNEIFEMDKVRRVLELARPWVKEEAPK